MEETGQGLCVWEERQAHTVWGSNGSYEQKRSIAKETETYVQFYLEILFLGWLMQLILWQNETILS